MTIAIITERLLERVREGGFGTAAHHLGNLGKRRAKILTAGVAGFSGIVAHRYYGEDWQLPVHID